MILCINYADEKFQPWQRLQTKTAYYFGADAVIEYSPKDIPPDFYAKNKFILDQPRGAGYWLWKPLIIKDALAKVNVGDYVFYADSGAFYIQDIHIFADVMENEHTNVIAFELSSEYLERVWSKRDAFILMDCDNEEFANTNQRMATFIMLKKTSPWGGVIDLIDEYLEYGQDPRIITDMPNQLGKENYDDFRENSHDQTIWSLLTKKRGIKSFRDPTQFFELSNPKDYSEGVLERSTYPTMFCHKRRNINIDKTVKEFLLVHANEPRLCEGVRTAKYLIQEGMVKEAQEILQNLLQKYSDNADEAWTMVWDDLLYLIYKHENIGAPYAETFQPLLFKLLLQVIRVGIHPYNIHPLIQATNYVKNKKLIPQEFHYVSAVLVEEYIKRATNSELPAYMWTAQEMLTHYLETKA